MKKIMFAAALLVGAFVSAMAQNPDPDSRDKSRYAVNNFENDDLYTAVQTYEPVSVAQPEGKKVKNVILMIGDGMGLEQLSAAWVVNGRHLNITDNFPYTGLQWTYSASKLVTDSAAAGTALATGSKTNNGMIAMSPDRQPLETLSEYAKSKGMKTGTSVVCRICDATPAVFSTHAAHRDSLYDITAQFVDSRLDFLFGGGLRWWENRPDGRDLTAEVEAKGYTFVKDVKALEAVKEGPVIALTSYMELPAALDREGAHQASVAKALELLDNKKGFFLMVEGSCIDDYGHANKVGYVMEEIFDFDRTVGVVLEWAAKDGETLVIVTADHATGGMTLLDGNIAEQRVGVNFSNTGHNGVAIPVFAWGPRAEEFVGIYENAGLSQKIKKILK
ncbi:MAG: alkaline phosphatase [Bacteroidales bacterium]|nr:alkaline phosphatase [Bacteroidales bacterium]